MRAAVYDLQRTDAIVSPQLIYYKDQLLENTKEIIRIAGGVDRLWPHVKTHKCPDVIRMQIGMGITRFKCATIAEAEMVAMCEASDVVLAYPQVGPTVPRFLRLIAAFPRTRFWAIGDDFGQLQRLSEGALAQGITVRTLVDLDVGMHRTGVPMEQGVDFYARCAGLKGLHMQGFHCYDGHVHQDDLTERQAVVDAIVGRVATIKESLIHKGLECPIWIMAGSPSFPCYVRHKGFHLSPGTAFLWDYGYGSHFRDIDLVPAAAVLTRVVSHPGPGLFTLDLGNKGLAADPGEMRGVIVGLEHAESLGQNEEHWRFRLPENEVPAIGTVLYVIPTHICPTSALYPWVFVAEKGEVVNRWEITARVRTMTI